MLAYYLLLGLEFLVAADVLETILTPTVEHVLVLGGVVLIRMGDRNLAQLGARSRGCGAGPPPGSVEGWRAGEVERGRGEVN